MTPTPTQALEPVEVSQADRNAAARWAENYIGRELSVQFVGQTRDGTNDSLPHSLAVAFARHRQSSNAAGVGVDDLVEHFPTGVRGLYDRTAGGVPVQSHVGTNCACGWCTSATDEHEVRQQWAEHVLASLGEQFAENAKCSGDALREALEDTMSTLSAVKAEAIVDGGGTCLWIAEKLNQQMIDNRAALSATPSAQEGEGDD